MIESTKPYFNAEKFPAHGMVEDFYSANHDAFVTCSVNLNVRLKADCEM